MLIGGFDKNENDLKTVEVLENVNCSVPDLPSPLAHHSSMITPDKRILVCGGVQDADPQAVLPIWLNFTEILFPIP